MQDIAPDRSLIDYPSAFPLKVMGANVEGFLDTVFEVASGFDPGLQRDAMESRLSSGGRYMGVTVTITATSREMLDEVYRALSSHPMVKVVL